jgi:hypothetical protein
MQLVCMQKLREGACEEECEGGVVGGWDSETCEKKES